jgi:hypothetical protein
MYVAIGPTAEVGMLDSVGLRGLQHRTACAITYYMRGDTRGHSHSPAAGPPEAPPPPPTSPGLF